MGEKLEPVEVLVSPTEPASMKHLGRVSGQPERHGADVLLIRSPRSKTKRAVLGVQRKTWPDLLGSLEDGRLANGIHKLSTVDLAVLVIEGRAATTSDGLILRSAGRPWSMTGVRKLLWSVRQRGIWVDRTEGLSDTVMWVGALGEWWATETHRSLDKRPVRRWATTENRDFAIWVLQGFGGIGPELAGRIYDRVGLPLRWTIGENELCQVEGIGTKKAKQLICSLEKDNDRSP